MYIDSYTYVYTYEYTFGMPTPLEPHPRPFVGVSQKSIFKRPCQVLAINAHKMAPRTSKRLQERAWDAPT